MGFAVLYPFYKSLFSIGWVERSETQQSRNSNRGYGKSVNYFGGVLKDANFLFCLRSALDPKETFRLRVTPNISGARLWRVRWIILLAFYFPTYRVAGPGTESIRSNSKPAVLNNSSISGNV
jgi:hypothetical protein